MKTLEQNAKPAQVNNKNTGTTSTKPLLSLLLTWTYFIYRSGVSISDFEQANIGEEEELEKQLPSN